MSKYQLAEINIGRMKGVNINGNELGNMVKF